MKTIRNFKTVVITFIIVFLFSLNLLAQSGIGQGPPWVTLGNNIDQTKHFFGTVNRADVVFKTHSIEKARLTIDGKFGIGTPTPTTTLDVHGIMSFDDGFGDKISLYGDRTGLTNMYGFGMESSAIYYKSAGDHKWYSQTNPGSGDPVMTMSADGLGIGTMSPSSALDVHGEMTFGNTFGDKISLFDDRIGLNTMYGFGMESSAIFYKSAGDHKWYSQTNPGSGDPVMTMSADGLGIGTMSPSSALDVHGEMTFGNTLGDKISLFDDRIGLNTMYGLGVGDGTLYYKSNGTHKWYSQTNSGAGDPHMTLTSDGFLGIGTDNPNVNLTVEGANARLVLRDNAVNNSANAARIELLEYTGGSFSDGAFMWWNGNSNRFLIGTKNAGVNENILVLDQANLNVGIGTQNLDINYRLAVNGRIRAKEVVVESGWSDFVFESDYKLRSLEEVENYIKQNGHLPEIPSAKDIEANGVPVGEMQSKLLMKIEELTLYMIELKKENDQLKRAVQELENN